MCTGVEVALAVSAAAAAASTGVAVANYEASQDAASAQRGLVDQQKQQLQQQQDAAKALAASEATTGATFGFSGDLNSESLKTGLGFGAAPTNSPNSGRSQITGMS